MRILKSIIVACMLCFADIAIGADLRVPEDFPTIQAAIDLASNGDQILVSPGAFVGNVDFKGKSLLVSSVGGAEDTILEPEHRELPILTVDGLRAFTSFTGFTLRGGMASAVLLRGSPAYLTDNIITGNCVGIKVDMGAPHILRNTIAQNGLDNECLERAAVIAKNGGPFILNNTIERNFTDSSAAAIRISESYDVGVFWNVVRENSGSGISMDGSRAKIGGNLIAQNSGPGIFWVSAGPMVSQVAFNTIVDNDFPRASAFFAQGRVSNVRMLNNILAAPPNQNVTECIEGQDEVPFFVCNQFDSTDIELSRGCGDPVGSQIMNLWGDPLFVDREGENYRLTASSPAIDSANERAGLTPPHDLDGTERIIDGDRDGVAAPDRGAFERSSGPPGPLTDGGTADDGALPMNPGSDASTGDSGRPSRHDLAELDSVGCDCSTERPVRALNFVEILVLLTIALAMRARLIA